MPHIAIIGAEITGVTTAYALLNRGFEVSVFDRHRYAGMETSFANGGQLSASNAEVWNKMSTIIQGIKWMMRRDAPLLVNPAPSWHKYSWMAEFVANISKYEANTIRTVRLAIDARKHMFEIAERESLDFHLERRGILHFYRDRTSFEKGMKVNPLLKQGGLDRHSVTPGFFFFFFFFFFFSIPLGTFTSLQGALRRLARGGARISGTTAQSSELSARASAT